MSRNDTNTKNREAIERTSEDFERTVSNGVNVLRNGSWNAIAGLQEYNEKLIEIAQNNINMTLDFFRRTARMKSPLEFITVATEHARRQYETSTEQTKELAELAQSLALDAAKPVTQVARRRS